MAFALLQFIISILLLHTCSSDYTSCVNTQSSSAVYKWYCWQYFPNNVVDWSTAMSACQNDGGTLVTIYSQDYWVNLQYYLDAVAPSAAPWVALYSPDENTAPSWMNGPIIPTDASAVTTATQNLLNANFTVTPTFCGMARQNCPSPPVLSCCYYMRRIPGSMNQYDLNSLPCTLSCAGPTYLTKPYICEYENCAQSSLFENVAGEKFNTGIVPLATITNSSVTNATACAQMCIVTKYCVSFDIKLPPFPKCILYSTNLDESLSYLTSSGGSGLEHYDMTKGPGI